MAEGQLEIICSHRYSAQLDFSDSPPPPPARPEGNWIWKPRFGVPSTWRLHSILMISVATVYVTGVILFACGEY